jgi:antitoxin ParD1/3/4
METVSISLPDSLKSFVEELITRGDYVSTSDYVQELIREDRKRRETERLEAMLLEGLHSGPMTEMTADDWESIRREVRERLAMPRNRTDGPETRPNP